MNKKLVGFLLIFALLVAFALNNSTLVQNFVIAPLNNIKQLYHTAFSYARDTVNQHFYQQEYLEQLQEKLKLYEKNHLISHQIASELNRLYQENNATFSSHPDLALVQGLSYVTLGDMNKIWLHMDDFNSSKIYGLVHKERVAGIVIAKNNQPLALLNNDPKCSYAVSIGKHKAPGIIHGRNQQEMLIEFIPSWIPIHVGDEVVTSGLDNLFFSNILVGTVTKLSQSQGYRNATVLPYYQESDIGFFHVITQVR
ncbi:MAG: rod shape-determining protein MreC [Sulfurimonas sp.]|nr:MAG: rod shape-determining protein MreC [Sulfurimonas sp.]